MDSMSIVFTAMIDISSTNHIKYQYVTKFLKYLHMHTIKNNILFYHYHSTENLYVPHFKVSLSYLKLEQLKFITKSHHQDNSQLHAFQSINKEMINND